MGRPVDRAKGVILVTDYGALDWALDLRARKAAKREEDVKKLNDLYSQED